MSLQGEIHQSDAETAMPEFTYSIPNLLPFNACGTSLSNEQHLESMTDAIQNSMNIVNADPNIWTWPNPNNPPAYQFPGLENSLTAPTSVDFTTSADLGVQTHDTKCTAFELGQKIDNVAKEIAYKIDSFQNEMWDKIDQLGKLIQQTTETIEQKVDKLEKKMVPRILRVENIADNLYNGLEEETRKLSVEVDTKIQDLREYAGQVERLVGGVIESNRFD